MSIYCKDCKWYDWEAYMLGTCGHSSNIKEKNTWKEKEFVRIKRCDDLNKHNNCPYYESTKPNSQKSKSKKKGKKKLSNHNANFLGQLHAMYLMGEII